MKEKPLIIFGTGQVSEILSFYLERLNRKIFAYCVDEKYYNKTSFKKKKVLTTKQVLKKYKPKDVNLHVALSYSKLNFLREKKFINFKKKGYFLESFITNKNIFSTNHKIGENCLIIDSHIQPFAKIQNNAYIWSGSVIGHHSTLKNHIWISGGTAIGGNSIIGDRCFLGMNVTIGHFVKVEKKCFLSAGAILTKNIKQNSVVFQSESKKLEYSAQDFIQITDVK